jgi:hypothetical protein
VNETLGRWGSGRIYTNFSDRRVDTRSIFPADVHARLQTLKRLMDPDQLFHASQEIAPAD